SASCIGDTLYRKLSGTSMAAPQVAAAAALMMRKFSDLNLSPQKIVEHLGDTAREIKDPELYTDSDGEEHELNIQSGHLDLATALEQEPDGVQTRLELETEENQKQFEEEQNLSQSKKINKSLAKKGKS
ncbi:MAG: S8 family serine peptidase, partial [Verrucomicrobiota bacterium]